MDHGSKEEKAEEEDAGTFCQVPTVGTGMGNNSDRERNLKPCSSPQLPFPPTELSQDDLILGGRMDMAMKDPWWLEPKLWWLFVTCDQIRKPEIISIRPSLWNRRARTRILCIPGIQIECRRKTDVT